MVPWASIGVALLAMFQFGMAVVVINTMMDDLSEDLKFDKSVGGGLATSALYFGSGVGSLLAGPVNKFCMEYAQLCIGLLFTLGNILCALSTEHKLCWGGSLEGCVPDMILAGRLITGFGSGLTLVSSPRYLAAASPADIRGTIGACSQMSIALGAFLGLLIGLPFEVDSLSVGYEWWRVMFFIATAPAVLQCFLAVLTRSSFRAVFAESRNELKEVHTKDARTIETVAVSTVDAVDVENPPQKEASERTHTKPAWVKGLGRYFERRYRRSVILGIGVPIACQLAGISIVASYSTTIFEEAGLNLTVIGSILFGLAMFASSSISAFVCDQFKRTTLVNVSFTGMAVSYLGLALSDLADSRFAGPLSVVFVLTYALSFGAGCGFITVGYAPEVVPPEIADVVLGTGQSLSIFLSVFLVLLFPSALDAVGILGSSSVLMIASLISLLFLKAYMIETRGRDLKSINDEITSF